MPTQSKLRFIDEALIQRKREHRFRELTACDPDGQSTVSVEGRKLINFSGNDYLGLSQNAEVIARSQQYADKYGAGSTASRLISGTFSIHERLEKKLAEVFGWEAATVFNSGFQANSTIISTLADRRSLILTDKLSHNSLLQGALSSRADFRRFEHNSIGDLEDELEKASGESYKRIIIVTESLFSMDGDRSDLQSIAQLAENYGSWLFVDDAHAVGVWGQNGLGLVHGISGIDLVLGTCGKAFGAFGAFLLSSQKVKDYLVNFCPGFIYTTALPPSVIGAIEASLELIPEMDEEREKLYSHIEYMRNGIHRIGFITGDSDSQIIPIMVGNDEDTLKLADYLKEKGFLAVAIRPPTVPKGSARIRVTLSASHTRKQIHQFLNALEGWKNG